MLLLGLPAAASAAAPDLVHERRCHRLPGDTARHTWVLAERHGNAGAGTATTATMKLPKAALARLRKKHLSALLSFDLDGINVNGDAARTVRLKLK